MKNVRFGCKGKGNGRLATRHLLRKSRGNGLANGGWNEKKSTNRQSFVQFQADPMKWATGGGRDRRALWRGLKISSKPMYGNMNSNNLPENVGISDNPVASSADAPVPVRRQVQNIEPRNENSRETVNKIDEAGITLGTKMYINPLRDVVPMQIENMPLQTERVYTEREIHNYRFSPVTWCEPLRVYRWQFNERPVNNVAPVLYNHSIVDLAHFTVDVSNVQRAEQNTPALSTLATTLRAYMGTDAVTASGTALRSFQPQRNLRDIQSLAAIVERLPSSPASYYDEAPLLRCLLLMNTMASTNYFQCHSAIVQQTFMNLRPTGAPVTAWSALPADNIAGRQSPAQANGTDNMVAMCLDTYTRWLQGNPVNAHANWVNTTPDMCTVVPVQSNWMCREWLIGYITCFTTTAWWNFSRTVVFPALLIRPTGVPSQNTQIQCIVDACTNVVTGRYANIVLVITDRTSDSYQAG